MASLGQRGGRNSGSVKGHGSGGGRGGSGGGGRASKGQEGFGGSGNANMGECFEWQNTGKCRFGSSCKFRHGNVKTSSNNPSSSRSSSRNSGNNHGRGNGGGGGNRHNNDYNDNSNSSNVIARNPQAAANYIKHLQQVDSKRLGDEIQRSRDLWMRCWREHAALDHTRLRELVTIVTNIPGSASVGPPPISHCQDAVLMLVDVHVKKLRSPPPEILIIAELVYKVVGRLLEFEWDCEASVVKDALSNMLAKAQSCLIVQIREHGDVARQILSKLEDLEKPWRIRVQPQLADPSPGSSSDTTAEATGYLDWQRATIKWLSDPSLFSPSCLPAFKVPYKAGNGVYNSSKEYMDTVHQVWVGMTFADGHGALAPSCRCKGPSGTTCQRTLWPIHTSAAANSTSQLRCRSDHCQENVAFSCRTKHHDALCQSCFQRACSHHLGGPGQRASTHIYDARVHHSTSDGVLYLNDVKSRNPPIHQVHWRTSRRLQTPNLVGLVKLRSKEAALTGRDLIKWGEIVFHGESRDEGKRRERGDLAVNLSNFSVEFDHDYFEDGSYVAVIDCMTFVPEWIPVLLALEKQRKSVLPFDDGKHLNLWANQPCDVTNSILTGSTPEEVFKTEVTTLMDTMIEKSTLEPIREIRREPGLRSDMLSMLCLLVKETTLDNMQLVSFIGALLNPVHLTQGPPGTGKSYLGVALVRALIIIRDLWVKKSGNGGTPPILVLSYKNHAIDEFLVDLVKAEGASKMRNRLVRLGGQCKDPRLAVFSERAAFQADRDVGICRRRFDVLFKLQKSIQIINDEMVSFFAYCHDMFGTIDGSSTDEQKARTTAANKAAYMLMVSLVTRKLLSKSLASIEQMNEQNDVVGTVADAFAFLELDSDRQWSPVIENRVNKNEEASLVRSLVAEVEHYGLEHWGEIILLWITGKIPLPRCLFTSEEGTQCDLFGSSPDLPLCAKHRCHFRGKNEEICHSPCVGERKPFCVNHLCLIEDCTKARYGNDQGFCHRHGCKRCFELGLISGPATDDPPRNSCSDHPMCGYPGCLEFSDKEYCSSHLEIRCLANTRQGKPCKGNPISRDVPYCRDHVEHMPKDMVSDDDESIDDEECKQEYFDGKCHAMTKKGKICKGTPIRGTRFCREHAPIEYKQNVKKTKFFVGETGAVEGVLESLKTGKYLPWMEATPLQLSPDVPKNGSQPSIFMQLGSDGPSSVLPDSNHAGIEDKPAISSDMEANHLQQSPDDQHAQQPIIPMQQGSDNLRDDASSVSSGSIHAGIEDKPALGEPDEVEICEDEEEAEPIQHLSDVHEVQNRNDDVLPEEDSKDGSSSIQGEEDMESDSKPTSDPSSWTWSSSLEERWRMCQEHLDVQRSQLEKTSQLVRRALQVARREHQKAQIRAKARLYENRSVIGGTMVGCVSRLDSIRSVRPFAVVVEEASEVLEPLLFSCLCDSTMKLEMIGDHRQLQPSIMSRYDFEIHNDVNVSMFQRLIEAPGANLVPSDVLSVQRRMRRNICDMTRSYYEDIVAIEDHECCGLQRVGDRDRDASKVLAKASTKGREIPGIGPHIFLWTHHGDQKKAQVGLSRVNDHEAKMACSLASYLVHCGVPKTSITILTPYKGQLMLMRNMLLANPVYSGAKLLSRDLNETDVCRVSTVDRFQGDESDIVIISMVVDEKSRTAFVQLKNRLVVLLSRARLGMYLLANVGYFYSNSNSLPKHWAATFEMLEKPSPMDSPDLNETDIFKGTRVGSELPLCCPLHRSSSHCVSDPSQLKLGFCNICCEATLPCGHPCSKPCHWPHSRHNNQCVKELLSPCLVHPVLVPCYVVYKNLHDASPGLNHTDVLKFFKCPQKVKLTMPCGHATNISCWLVREIESGQRPLPDCKEQSAAPFVYPSCKHRLKGVCCDVEKWTKNPSSAPICRKKATYVPPFCEHIVELECHKREGYVADPEAFQCPEKETSELPRCGHAHKLSCWTIRNLAKWSGRRCDVAGKVHENVDYGPKDYACKEIVTVVRSCDHEICLPCENAFDRTYCSEPCCELVRTGNRICGHPCEVSCGVAQAMADIPVPEAVGSLVEGCISCPDLSMLSNAQNKCKVLVKVVRTCGHTIDIECHRARRPLPPCEAPIQATSPLCFHQLNIPCHFKQSFEQSIWPAAMIPQDTTKFVIPWNATLTRGPEAIKQNLKEILRTCQSTSVFVYECGHKHNLSCSDLLYRLSGKETSQCNEIVPLVLSCGHRCEVKCSHSTRPVICAAVVGKQCWNFSTCARILEAPCSFKGLVACQGDSKWLCSKGSHSYEVDLCRNGIPLSCPGCCTDRLDEIIHIPPPLRQMQLFYDDIFSQLLEVNVDRFSSPLDTFFELERTRLRQYRYYIASVPLMERQIFKLHRVPVFRNLVDEKLWPLESFDPKKLSKQRTLFGVLVKELTSANLRELSSSSLKTGGKVVLLVGLASIVRAHLENGTFPRAGNKSSEKKMKKYADKLQVNGFDSVVFKENEFRNLIVWHPYPMIAFGRLRLSAAELTILADNLEGKDNEDIFPKYIERALPGKNIRLAAPYHDPENSVECADVLDDADAMVKNTVT